jgi:hypothetical protein
MKIWKTGLSRIKVILATTLEVKLEHLKKPKTMNIKKNKKKASFHLY